jgi:hypothetical protein
MSIPLDREPGLDDQSPYAPKWVRERPAAQRLAVQNVPDDGWSEDPPPIGGQEATVVESAAPRSLDPTILAQPALRGRSLVNTIAAVVLTVATAAAVALFVVSMLPGSPRIAARAPAEEPNSFSSRYSDTPAATASRSEPAVPQMVVAQTVIGQNDDALPLGLTLSGAANGAVVMISGLASGTTLSTGRAEGPDSWRLSPNELSGAAVQPPRGFTGAMEVLAELRLADGTVVERRPLHFERAPPPQPRQATRQLDPEELAALIKRGEDYIATGDLASARLVLQRAAEGGDARAALALAGTYDPNVLEQLGVRGFAPDIGRALAWYEKARDFGSAEAPRRLERLASRDR